MFKTVVAVTLHLMRILRFSIQVNSAGSSSSVPTDLDALVSCNMLCFPVFHCILSVDYVS